jgi:hypothetical protein
MHMAFEHCYKICIYKSLMYVSVQGSAVSGLQERKRIY